jgi:hypothetical protein
MPLSDRVQSAIVAASAALLSLGTAAAAIPEFVPADAKVYFAVTFWLAGIFGLALKEALGSKSPAAAIPKA